MPIHQWSQLSEKMGKFKGLYELSKLKECGRYGAIVLQGALTSFQKNGGDVYEKSL